MKTHCIQTPILFSYSPPGTVAPPPHYCSPHYILFCFCFIHTPYYFTSLSQLPYRYTVRYFLPPATATPCTTQVREANSLARTDILGFWFLKTEALLYFFRRSLRLRQDNGSHVVEEKILIFAFQQIPFLTIRGWIYFCLYEYFLGRMTLCKSQ